jgi:hypothetical protein
MIPAPCCSPSTLLIPHGSFTPASRIPRATAPDRHCASTFLGQMDIFLNRTITWDNPPNVAMNEETRDRVLRNITVAFQWAGFNVGFFLLDELDSPTE